MGAHKRFSEDGDRDDVKESSGGGKFQVPGPAPSIKKKNKIPPSNNGKKGSKSIRGQIRDVQRLLNNKKKELAPAARKAKQQQLEELVRVRDEHDRRESERSMAKKYHMVRFFEKRKLQRVLDNIVKKGDKPEDAEEKKQIIRDLRYINEYPKGQKYVALFPSGGHTTESKERVEQIRARIEGAVAVAEESEKRRRDGNKAKLATGGDDFFLEDNSD